MPESSIDQSCARGHRLNRIYIVSLDISTNPYWNLVRLFCFWISFAGGTYWPWTSTGFAPLKFDRVGSMPIGRFAYANMAGNADRGCCRIWDHVFFLLIRRPFFPHTKETAWDITGRWWRSAWLRRCYPGIDPGFAAGMAIDLVWSFVWNFIGWFGQLIAYFWAGHHREISVIDGLHRLWTIFHYYSNNFAIFSKFNKSGSTHNLISGNTM